MPQLEERVSLRYTVAELVKAGILPEDGNLLFATALVNSQGQLDIEFILAVRAHQVKPSPTSMEEKPNV